MQHPTIHLKYGDTTRLQNGHPWIYRGQIKNLDEKLEPGSLVQVRDHRRRFLGVGYFNPKSIITVRLISFEKEADDEAFFERRIQAAVDLRQKLFPEYPHYRVINAESDFLSGLIVDKFRDVLVVQISSLGMEQRKRRVFSALKKILKPKTIIERNDGTFREVEGMDRFHRVTFGPKVEKMNLNINGLTFEMNPMSGHKTGFYLDQQFNYQKVADLMGKGNVLDCFSFMGGFALHSAKAGAQKVTGLEQSEAANESARKNAELNGLTSKCDFQTANVFDWLKSKTSATDSSIEEYDGIILDPPSFTRNKKAVGNALRGYKEIHLRALKLLRPGGIIATFSCSHHIDRDLFRSVILDAARDCRVQLREAAIFQQPADHPIILGIPETEYLRGFAYQLIA